MATYVLDSFALLAFLRDEPGTKRVSELLRDAAQGDVRLHISLINYGELLYIVERRLGAVELRRVIAYLDNLPIEIAAIDRSLTGRAAHIKAHHSISFADSFAVALAQEFNAPVVTGDPEFREVEDTIEIEWLLQPNNGG